MKSVIIAVVLFCVALIGLGWYLGTREDTGGPRTIPIDKSYTDRMKVGGWVEGPASPKVTLTEFSDFQCPACGAMYPIINAALGDVSSYTQFTYRSYPLVNIHNKSSQAALAAESAGRQGKFWPMHELLFSRQSEWAEDTVSAFNSRLTDYADLLGLDVTQFKRDLKDNTTQDGIDADVNAGNLINLQGTPTLVINGTVITKLPNSKEALEAMINRARDGGDPNAS